MSKKELTNSLSVIEDLYNSNAKFFKLVGPQETFAPLKIAENNTKQHLVLVKRPGVRVEANAVDRFADRTITREIHDDETQIILVARGTAMVKLEIETNMTDAAMPTDCGSCGGGGANNGKTIVELLVRMPEFSVLVAAATTAKLVEALGTMGLTLFAPPNAAFKKQSLDEKSVAKIPAPALSHILLNHVAKSDSGPLNAEMLTKMALQGKKLKMLNEKDLPLTLVGKALYIGTAKVTKADIRAKNGLIHTIDGVITTTSAPDSFAMPFPASSSDQTSIGGKDGNFTTYNIQVDELEMFVIPAGVPHTIMQKKGSVDLKLVSVYAKDPSV